MANVSKLYWALCALGLPEEARRIRKEALAARDGSPEALRRLEASARKLGWALSALGTSEEARRLRRAAMAARAGDSGAQAYLDHASSRQPWQPEPDPDAHPPPEEPAAVPGGPAAAPVAEAEVPVAPAEAPAPALPAPEAAALPAAAAEVPIVPAEPLAPAVPVPEPAALPAEEAVPVPEPAAPPAAETEVAAVPAEPLAPAVPVPVPEAQAAAAPNLSAGRRQFSLPAAGLPSLSRRRWGRRAVAGVLLLALLGAGALAARFLATHREGLAAAWSRGRASTASAWALAADAVRRLAGAVAGSSPAPPPEPAPASGPPARSARGKASRAAKSPAAAPAGTAATQSGDRAARYLWRAGTWGMTAAEVLRAFPRARQIGGPVSGGEGLGARVALENVRMAGQPWSARFLFDGAGRLGAIQLRPAGPPSAASRARDDLAAALTADYGRPRSEGPEAPRENGSRLTWVTPDAVIELQDREIESALARILALDMEAGDLRPLPDRGVVLTLGPPDLPVP